MGKVQAPFLIDLLFFTLQGGQHQVLLTIGVDLAGIPGDA